MSEVKYDAVNPKHYAGSTSLECIEVMQLIFGKTAVMCFCICNAFKYMWRYKNKNGKEDLKKAEWYLNWVGNNSSIKYTKYKEQFIKLSELHEHLVARVDR